MFRQSTKERKRGVVGFLTGTDENLSVVSDVSSEHRGNKQGVVCERRGQWGTMNEQRRLNQSKCDDKDDSGDDKWCCGRQRRMPGLVR